MKSRILYGSVWHMRTEPRYFFRYRVFYLDLALEEIEDVAARIWPFSHNRFNLLSLRDADYLTLSGYFHRAANAGPGRGAAPLRPVEDPRHREHPVATQGLSLLTQPRILGYAFNPVSFLLHRDSGGAVDHVVAEVHNTWGERHLYDLSPPVPGAGYDAGVDKSFYVSPFMDSEGLYTFRLREGPARLRFRIDETRPGEVQPFFRSGMDLTPLPVTNTNVFLMLVRYPLTNLKTIAAIHWQGLRLWLRGEPFRPNRGRRKARVTA